AVAGRCDQRRGVGYFGQAGTVSRSAQAKLGSRQGNLARPKAADARRALRPKSARQTGEGRQDQNQQERNGADEPFERGLLSCFARRYVASDENEERRVGK